VHLTALDPLPCAVLVQSSRIRVSMSCVNNKRICIAQVCRMTSKALGGQLQSCYTARARPKCLTEEKCFKSTLEQS